jgi:hypothetical protein
VSITPESNASQSDRDIFEECKERFRIASDHESENRSEAINALYFFYGDQWPETLAQSREEDEQPALTINHTDTFCNRVENNMRQQRPRIKAHPVGEGADVEDAKIINGLIRHTETLSRASVAYDRGGASAVKIGWGYWRIVAEYIDEKSFDQELLIKPVRNTFTGYCDPAALMPDASDMSWFIFAEDMKRAEFKRKYPRAENSEWREAGTGDATDWENKENIRLAEYYRITEKSEKLYKMADGTSMFASDLPEPETMVAANYDFARDEKGKPICRSSCRRVVEWFRINGKEVVDRRELPGKYIPVVRVEGNVLDVNGKVRRWGMVKNLMDPQRMYNYFKSQETARLALAPKAPWIAAMGQVENHAEWVDANRGAYSILTYDPVAGPDGATLPPPIRQAPIQADAGIVEAAQGAEHDLLAVAGMPHEPAQDHAGEVISGAALRERQALSDISHFQYYDNQAFSMSHTGRILLDLYSHYYDTERMQRIIGEDGVPQMVKINEKVRDPQTQAILEIKNNLCVGRYDVVMDAGPGYETKRQEGVDSMLGLLKTPLGEPIAKVASDLVVRNMDFAGADDLADRLVPLNPEGMQKAIKELPKPAQAIVGALQQQLNETQQALQHAQLELKYKTSTELGWMQVEREKSHISAETKTRDTHTNAQTKVFDTHIKADTALKVAEINAGAELLNTHAEAKHDMEAAKVLAKNAEKAEAKPN